MAYIGKIYEQVGAQLLPQTVTDAVLDVTMTENLTAILERKIDSDKDGVIDGKLTVGSLVVNGKATFTEMAIDKVKHIGAKQVISAAHGKIVEVDEIATNFICYLATEEDGSRAANQWQVGDLALCQTIGSLAADGAASNKFYWRRVERVGYHASKKMNFIFLDHGEGDAPEVGDEVVLYGSSISGRDTAIILASYDSGVSEPYIKVLQGIDKGKETEVVAQLSPSVNILKAEQTRVLTPTGEAVALFNSDGTIAANVIKAYSAGVLRSAYNANGNGTITYYYPSGQKMKEDVFIYDVNGDVDGMRTIYYNKDGSVRWYTDEQGVLHNQAIDYWENISGTICSEDDLQRIVAEKIVAEPYLWVGSFAEAAIFHAGQNSQYSSYDGKIAYAAASSAMPSNLTLWMDGYFIRERNATAVTTDGRTTYSWTAQKIENGAVTGVKLIEFTI